MNRRAMDQRLFILEGEVRGISATLSALQESATAHGDEIEALSCRVESIAVICAVCQDVVLRHEAQDVRTPEETEFLYEEQWVCPKCRAKIRSAGEAT